MELLMKSNAVEVERLAERQTSKDVVIQAKKFAEQRRKIKEQRMKSNLWIRPESIQYPIRVKLKTSSNKAVTTNHGKLLIS